MDHGQAGAAGEESNPPTARAAHDVGWASRSTRSIIGASRSYASLCGGRHGVGEPLEVANTGGIHLGQMPWEQDVPAMAGAVHGPAVSGHIRSDELAVVGEAFVSQRVELVDRDDMR